MQGTNLDIEVNDAMLRLVDENPGINMGIDRDTELKRSIMTSLNCPEIKINGGGTVSIGSASRYLIGSEFRKLYWRARQRGAR